MRLARFSKPHSASLTVSPLGGDRVLVELPRQASRLLRPAARRPPEAGGPCRGIWSRSSTLELGMRRTGWHSAVSCASFLRYRLYSRRAHPYGCRVRARPDRSLIQRGSAISSEALYLGESMRGLPTTIGWAQRRLWVNLSPCAAKAERQPSVRNRAHAGPPGGYRIAPIPAVRL